MPQPLFHGSHASCNIQQAGLSYVFLAAVPGAYDNESILLRQLQMAVLY